MIDNVSYFDNESKANNLDWENLVSETSALRLNY